MQGLVDGIYKICETLKPVAGALLILSLMLAGIESYIGGEEGHMKLRKSMKWVIIGSGVTFGAAMIGPEIISWFS